MEKRDLEDHYLYHRTQEFKIVLPLQFWLICKLLQVPPGKVLIEFMRNVGREPDAIEETRKNTAMDYFLNCEYGQQQLTRKDIHQMLLELDAIAALWPGMGTSRHMEKHVQLRDRYHELWQKKWEDLQNL
ncbi:MAG TPA: hypothetical protein VNS58_18795 [Puia sp.]|nr:hypothetical protein [Puia sp.]